ncbi:HD domain-containing protein [Dongia soli]|uniref:HD domain-containing protein n=1 Tax=Dongia soli TaxID=600628 RepID=A0ABU5EJV0_9PROT|nr:HD domain-containing protein [Dongia soli]MDY0885590.1 HD domain-containing protein [Dongia soli]
MSKTVSFLQMKDGTRDDYLLLDQSERNFATGLPGRVMEALAKLDHSLEGYKVSRLEHSLQSATRAEADGADEEMIVAALIHDIGDELAPYNHAEIAAGMIRPYVRAEVTWVVEQHGIFQMYYYAHHLGGDRNARDRFRDHHWYASCERFCERWDQASFDPDYASKPLSYWEPLVRDIFGRQAHDPRYVKSAA